ncbi:hypothetical protein [Vibrio phage LP.2]|nr:hypothetical protein [Vibrio phage LP.2]
MNRMQSKKQRELVFEHFERFAKRELKLEDEHFKRKHDTYIDRSVMVLFFMFNAGYHTHMTDTLTFGCPTLERLYEMKHPNVSWWNED